MLILCAKTVTLGRTHWSDTNRVMLRNRRIGCSVSGVVQFITNRGLDELKEWLNGGFDVIQQWDKQYSDWMKFHDLSRPHRSNHQEQFHY